MTKRFSQYLAVFLWTLLVSVPAQADSLEKAEGWVRWMQETPGADGCAYNDGLLLGYGIPYGGLVRIWNEDEAVSFSEQAPLHYLEFLDASLKACSLPAGKDTPDPNASENKWLERFDFYQHPDYDAHFDHADALALAGPSVKDGVTRYWKQDGKTHIRFALNGTARDLRSWAKRRGIALQLTRQQTNGPVFYGDLPILRGKTAIPVFVVSPEGLTSARIVDFSGDWVEVVLGNDTMPPVWAVIALRDPGLAKKAKVTRQRQLETQKEGTHYLELKRGVLRLEFENNALPPLTLVARQLAFWESTVEMGEKEDEWIETEKTLRGSVWGTEIFIPDEAYAKEREWNPSATFTFGRAISFLGSPRCPPPAPE
ncbi:MAG: hypothetical protein LBU11_01755 [Zoogloeaceae bacterium]|nr:hypothetical protein [Zoogloeaceae bacterium]